jgi:putative tryptophan/tyrosine transport system substrate-binding protein
MAIHIRRRELIAALGGAAAWPLVAHAQQSAMPVIGFLGTISPDRWSSRLHAFRQGLSETSYVEGRNVGIEYRWAEGQNDRLPALAADLVRRQLSVIAAPESTPAAFAAKAATTTIPIVFSVGVDPVAVGLVASLNRPGGNLTGVTNLNAEILPKRLELMHELVPTATTIALLVNPSNPLVAETESRDAQTAARTLGLQLHVLHASTDRDFDTVFASLAQMRAVALVINTDVFFNSRSEQLAALALRHTVPAIFQYREFVASGGLMSYGTGTTDVFRQVGIYTSRLLRGESPADLPVQVSPELWEQVQAVLDGRYAKKHRRAKHEFAFSALIASSGWCFPTYRSPRAIRSVWPSYAHTNCGMPKPRNAPAGGRLV